ncbi:XapX domain-containing protein [Sinorhizobium numidicum]|uniref:XapX domain-containing protein n=1 Tax=Sinorhizobium numidicum TaxID=680248 RepID=A0ABY8CQK6_9HYPH|nr:XapX domain-containing protein [Sinorhizobium numidicum]WEX74911.1 XapX domain-containing protein [Sinorhizobium numidicum]WEX80904.1 XapX domain-containing protein [Sinorhizobium numidicum]
MKMYLLSLGAGLLVGVIYSLLNVRSPAPPVIALVGLLGILVGEQAVPLVKRLMSGNPVNISWFNSHCLPHVFGELPTGAAHKPVVAPDQPSAREIS